MDSKELFRQFWAVGDESVWGDETKRMWKVWQAAWNARQPEVVSGLNGCGYDKCPKCGGGLATFRHPGAKVNCANCGLVLQEEGGRKLYQPTPYQNTVVSNAEVPIPTLAPVIGYTEQQMMDAMNHADFEGFYTVEENAEYLASITPSMPFVPTEDELITVFSEEYMKRPVGNRVYHGIKAIHALLTKGRGGAV